MIGCVDFKSNPVQVAGDESQHGWLCSNCGMYALTADHSYDDETGVCICGRTQSCDHASITTWTVNQENNSECGRWCSSCSQWLEGPMRHENSCKNEGYCFRCETALEGWEVEHNLAWNEDRDNEWVITEDGTQCGQYCLNCNAWLNGTPYNHRIGCMVPANHHGACERCGAAMPEDWQIEHNYFWIETENDQHAQQCWDCGEVVNTGDHTYNDDGWCTVCDAYVDCDHNSIGWTVNPDNDGECRRWCELCGWDEVREHRNGCKDEVNACERCGTSMDCEDQHNTWNKETKSEWTAVENTDQCIQRCFDCGEELEGPYRHFNWCQDTGKCDRCYTELGEDWGIDHHTWLEDEERDNWVDNGDGTHKKVCLECDAIVEEGRHGISCDAENKEVWSERGRSLHARRVLPCL